MSKLIRNSFWPISALLTTALMAASPVYGLSVQIVKNWSPQSNLQDLPEKYNGNVGSCQSLSSLSPFFPSSANPQKPQSAYFCSIKFYENPGYDDALEFSKSISGIGKIYNISSATPIRSLAPKNTCGMPMWAIACTGKNTDGTCTMTESNGHIHSIPKVNSFKVCSNPTDCIKSIGCEKIKGGCSSSDPRLILPCHSDLITMTKDDLKKAIGSIQEYVNDKEMTHIENHKTAMDDLVDYWGAIKKYQAEGKAKEKKDKIMKEFGDKIPDLSEAIDEARERKENIHRAIDSIFRVKTILSKDFKVVQSIRDQVQGEFLQWKKTIKSGIERIRNVPATSLEERASAIYEATKLLNTNKLKWKLVDSRIELNDIQSTLELATQIVARIPIPESHPELQDQINDVLLKVGNFQLKVKRLSGQLQELHDNPPLEQARLAIEKLKQQTITQTAAKEFHEKYKNIEALRRSNQFTDLIQERISFVANPPPTSPGIGMYLFAESYARHRDFITSEAQCSQQASWMKTGCLQLDNAVMKAKKFTNETLPKLLVQNTEWLSYLVAEENKFLINSINESIDAGEWQKAFTLYDRLILREEARL